MSAGSTVSTNVGGASATYALPMMSSGCPVIGEQAAQQQTPGGAQDSVSAQCSHNTVYTVVCTAGCPVVTSDFNVTNLMPKSSNEPTPDQQQMLDKQRVASSIPIGANHEQLD